MAKRTFGEFLRTQVASAFFITDGAHLVTDMLDEQSEDFMYYTVDDGGYIYLKGYANVNDLDYILKVLAITYGKNTRTYEYWLTMGRELKSENHD